MLFMAVLPLVDTAYNCIHYSDIFVHSRMLQLAELVHLNSKWRRNDIFNTHTYVYNVYVCVAYTVVAKPILIRFCFDCGSLMRYTLITQTKLTKNGVYVYQTKINRQHQKHRLLASISNRMGNGMQFFVM